MHYGKIARIFCEKIGLELVERACCHAVGHGHPLKGVSLVPVSGTAVTAYSLKDAHTGPFQFWRQNTKGGTVTDYVKLHGAISAQGTTNMVFTFGSSGKGGISLLLALFIGVHTASANVIGPPLPKQERALCDQISKAAQALPGSTQIEDWSALINVPGVSHPHWVSEDATKKIGLVMTVAASMSSLGLLLEKRHAPTSAAVWKNGKRTWLLAIRKGTVKVDSTEIDFRGGQIVDSTEPDFTGANSARVKVKLYRISLLGKSKGTLGPPAGFNRDAYKRDVAAQKKYRDEEPMRYWRKYIIASADGFPQIHNLLIHVDMQDMDVLVINGMAYFVVTIPLPGLVPITIPFPRSIEPGTVRPCELDPYGHRWGY
jgi:hypothetical protein